MSNDETLLFLVLYVSIELVLLDIWYKLSLAKAPKYVVFGAINPLTS